VRCWCSKRQPHKTITTVYIILKCTEQLRSCLNIYIYIYIYISVCVCVCFAPKFVGPEKGRLFCRACASTSSSMGQCDIDLAWAEVECCLLDQRSCVLKCQGFPQKFTFAINEISTQTCYKMCIFSQLLNKKLQMIKQTCQI
jgi:hypothetical protein